MINKKAESETMSLEMLIGIIIAIALLLVVAGVAFKFYKIEQGAQDSFNDLYEMIIGLEDQDSIIMQLGTNRFITVFEQEITEFKDGKINKPSKCEQLPCICLCTYLEDDDITADVCETGNCKDLSKYKDYDFLDENGYNVLIQGTETTARPVYIKKEENRFYISKSSTFQPEYYDDDIASFLEVLDSFSLASNSEVDCKVKLDFRDFLDKFQAIYFQEQETSLHNTDENAYEYYSSDLSFKVTYQGEELTNFWILPGFEYFILLDNLDAEEEIEAKAEVYSIEGKLHFLPKDSEEYSDLPECSEDLVAF